VAHALTVCALLRQCFPPSRLLAHLRRPPPKHPRQHFQPLFLPFNPHCLHVPTELRMETSLTSIAGAAVYHAPKKNSVLDTVIAVLAFVSLEKWVVQPVLRVLNAMFALGFRV